MSKLRCLAILCSVFSLAGCQHYLTPGGGMSMQEITEADLLVTDADLRAYYETKPATTFPASIAMVRVQDSGYQSHSYYGTGQGRYTVVTTRDIETEAAFEKLGSLENIRGVAPIGRMLVPVNANTVKDLRVPAAKLHADMILVYSVDTSFNVDGKQLGPLSLVSLGFFPNKKAHVTATVAGMLVDVRTGFIYGTTEATDIQTQRATVWSTAVAIETARLKAEKKAFEEFVGEFAELWAVVVNAHAGTAVAHPGNEPVGRGYYSIQLDEVR